LAVFVFIFALIGLFFLNLVPCVSVVEKNVIDSGQDFNLHFNLNMMKKSDNSQIRSLSDDIDIINYGFFTIIVLSLLSYLATIIKLSKKSFNSSKDLLTLGIIMLVVTLSVTFLFFLFISNVNRIDSIYNSSLLDSIYFIYVPLVFCLICILYSGLYVKVVFAAYKKQKKVPKEKKIKPKKTKSKVDKKQKKPVTKPQKKAVLKQKPQTQPNIKDSTPVVPVTEQKRDEMEQWLSEELKTIEHDSSDFDGKNQEMFEEKKEFSDENKSEPFVQKPIPDQKNQNIEPKDENTPTKSFEEALQTAIQKKHTGEPKKEQKPAEETIQDSPDIQKKDKPTMEQEKQILEEPSPQPQPALEKTEPEEKKPKQEEIKVRCPQCKHIFSAVKTGEVIKIKCPKCGKEGIAK
jgi:ribosomal protein S27E